MSVRLEKIILEVEDRASRPMATFAQSTRGASEALHDLDGSSSDSAQAVASTGKAAGTAAPKVSNLAAATAKAEAAQRKQADAAGALRVAEAKLAEVREKGAAKASAVSAAEERVAKARRNLTAETLRSSQAAEAVVSANDNIVVSNRKADQSINQLTGRLAVFRDVAVTIGPGLVPIGAVAIPAIVGLGSALGFTAIAAGAVVAGFQGVGDAMEAVNKAQLEPTAENLEAVQVAMAQLSPAAREIVASLDSLGPGFEKLRDASAAGLAPGIGVMADEMIDLLPKLSGIFEETSRAAGELAAGAATSLNSDRWSGFIGFLEREAPDAIRMLGGAAGDLASGLAQMWMAFDPLNDSVLGVIRNASSAFDDWATGLGQTQGFRDFVEYVRQSGPQVAEAFGSIGNAVLQIAEAAAPLGGPALAAISAIADGVAAIADSPLGTPFLAAVAAVTTLNRLLKVTAALSAATAGAGALGAGGAATAATAGAAGTAAATAGAAGAGTKLAAVAALATPITAAGVAAYLAWKPFVAMMDNIGNVDGLYQSVDTLAGKLSEGTIPLEFSAIREATAFLDSRSGAAEWKDDIERNLGTTYGKLKESDTAIADLDASLSQIAQQEGPRAAVRAFDDLTAKTGMTGSEIDSLKGRLTGFSSAVADVPEMKLPEDRALAQLGRELRQATNAGYQFKTSLDDVNSVLTKRSASRDYQASLDAATQSLKANGRTLDENTPKGRANAAALDQIGASAVNVASKMKGANRVEFLKGARANFIETARGMGATAREAEKLADKLGLVDRTKVDPKVFLNIDGFTRKMAQARADLLNLDRRKANPKADLDDRAFTGAQRRALNDVGVLDGKKPTPTADMNDNPFQGRRAAVMAALGVTDRFTANPTVSVNDQASGKLAAIRADIASIQSKSVDIVVNTIRNVFGGKNENGGLYDGPVRAFADGGYGVNGRYYSRDPQIVAGGANIQWGEKSTGWEAYISGKPGQRQRNVSILDEAAARLGVPGPGEAVALAARNAALMEQITSGGRQSAAAASASRMAPAQAVSVGFDGPAEVVLRMPDGSRQIAQIAARVADDRIDNYISSENARAGA